MFLPGLLGGDSIFLSSFVGGDSCPHFFPKTESNLMPYMSLIFKVFEYLGRSFSLKGGGLLTLPG